MTDPTIPPKPPAPPQNILGAQKQPAPLTGAAKILAGNASVRRAPAGLHKQGDPRPARIEGRVTGYDRQKHEARIATKRGEIIVKTDTPLPEGEEVVVEIYTSKGEEMARIALLRAQAALQDEAAAQTRPPLKAGDTVTALLVSDAPEAEATAAKPATAQQEALKNAAALLSKLSPADIAQLPKPLPVPPEVARSLALAGDMLSALQKLPLEQQQKILDYLSRPEVAAKIAALTAETPDENAAQALRQPLAATGKNAPPQAGALKNLMPLLESLQSPSPLPGALMPRMQGGAQPEGTLDSLLPRNMFSLRIVSVTPPGAQPPPAGPNVQTGTVDFITSTGAPAVKAGGQLFVLRQAAGVEVGSTVQFEATPLTARQVMAQERLAALETFHPLMAARWPALQEALAALAATPEMAAQLQRTLPAPTPRLATTTLFFLAALRLGAAENWLGPNLLQTLKDSGRQNIADRLGSDFGRISAQSKENAGGEWRGISMPLLHDGEISQIQFYIRRHADDDAQKDKNDDGAPRVAPTRFVLNLHLSRMGDMQLDGLLKEKHFDLILRSAEMLPPSMRRDLSDSFAKGLAQAGMQGGVSFQMRGAGWVSIGTAGAPQEI